MLYLYCLMLDYSLLYYVIVHCYNICIWFIDILHFKQIWLSVFTPKNIWVYLFLIVQIYKMRNVLLLSSTILKEIRCTQDFLLLYVSLCMILYVFISLAGQPNSVDMWGILLIYLFKILWYHILYLRCVCVLYSIHCLKRLYLTSKLTTNWVILN